MGSHAFECDCGQYYLIDDIVKLGQILSYFACRLKNPFAHHIWGGICLFAESNCESDGKVSGALDGEKKYGARATEEIWTYHWRGCSFIGSDLDYLCNHIFDFAPTGDHVKNFGREFTYILSQCRNLDFKHFGGQSKD